MKKLTLPQETIEELVELGILDHDLQITPRAVIPSIVGNAVNLQCDKLNIRLICRRPSSGRLRVEEQVSRYLRNNFKALVENDEGFWIKQILSYGIPDFDNRSKEYRRTNVEIKAGCSAFAELSAGDIIKKHEESLFCDLVFPELVEGINQHALRKRFERGVLAPVRYIEAESERHKRLSWCTSKEAKKSYVRSVSRIITLWQALTREEWYRLASVSLHDWKHMCVGWPDITVVTTSGLTLLEVKSKDCLRATQIHVIQRLKSVLGRERLGVVWVAQNSLTRDQVYYSKHIEDTRKWFSSSLSGRKKYRFSFPPWFKMRDS